MKKLIMGLALLTLVFGAQMAVAECSISGSITAMPTTDPSLPAWTYTLVIYWDTGSPYALSHADLLLDTSTGNCMCSDFAEALSWGDPIGSSDGVEDCTVDYAGNLECDGDPSIPGVDNILLKLEPYEVDGCEPGPTGTGTFVFYSEYPPAPIDEDILSLVDKFAGNYCFGNLTGDFPSMACNPVGAEGASWGGVKAHYR